MLRGQFGQQQEYRDGHVCMSARRQKAFVESATKTEKLMWRIRQGLKTPHLKVRNALQAEPTPRKGEERDDDAATALAAQQGGELLKLSGPGDYSSRLGRPSTPYQGKHVSRLKVEADVNYRSFAEQQKHCATESSAKRRQQQEAWELEENISSSLRRQAREAEKEKKEAWEKGGGGSSSSLPSSSRSSIRTSADAASTLSSSLCSARTAGRVSSCTPRARPCSSQGALSTRREGSEWEQAPHSSTPTSRSRTELGKKDSGIAAHLSNSSSSLRGKQLVEGSSVAEQVDLQPIALTRQLARGRGLTRVQVHDAPTAAAVRASRAEDWILRNYALKQRQEHQGGEKKTVSRPRTAASSRSERETQPRPRPGGRGAARAERPGSAPIERTVQERDGRGRMHGTVAETRNAGLLRTKYTHKNSKPPWGLHFAPGRKTKQGQQGGGHASCTSQPQEDQQVCAQQDKGWRPPTPMAAEKRQEKEALEHAVTRLQARMDSVERKLDTRRSSARHKGRRERGKVHGAGRRQGGRKKQQGAAAAPGSSCGGAVGSVELSPSARLFLEAI